MKWDSETSAWVRHALAQFRTEGNHLVVEMPLSVLGLTDVDKGNFYFKWADNPADIDDAISLCINGDTAPNRRFCYNYRWDYGTTGIDRVATTAAQLRAVSLSGCALRVECDKPFTVTSILGTTVASGESSGTLTMPGSGLYIVTSAGKSVKVAVK